MQEVQEEEGGMGNDEIQNMQEKAKEKQMWKQTCY